MVPVCFYVVISFSICILLALFDRSVIRLDEKEAQQVTDRITALKATKSSLQAQKVKEIWSFSNE